MVKKLLKTVIVLLLLALCAAAVFFYSIFISVERLSVSYHTISSTKIPEDLHQVSIGFLADLEYNNYMNKDRLNAMIATINEVKPDVIVFGGDIFNQPLLKEPTDATKQELIQLLSQIDAPLGKFAVLGEQDHANEHTLEMVKAILYASDFEILDNTSIKLRNGTSAYVNLIGVDAMIAGNIDLEQAFTDISAESFNILAAHCPDTALLTDLPKSSVDLMLAGHSHASQIYLPLIGSLSTQEGAQHYNHGKHTIGNMTLHITNGIGTYGMDMRLFSPPQLLVYRLQHEVIPPVEPETPQEETSTEEVAPPQEETPSEAPASTE